MRPQILFYNIVLLLGHISAQWQAYLLGYLQPNSGAKYNFAEDLGLTDFQVQVVVGTIYTFTNGFANVGFGVIADAYPRKWVWIGTCIAWTFLTFAESFCDTFVQLLFARMGFAILMGANVPLSVSLISDLNLPSERGVAQSIYAAGVYLGVGMSSLSLVIDDAFGWRDCIRVICGISWVLAIPMFFVPEPERNYTNRLEMVKLIEKEAGSFAQLEDKNADTSGADATSKPLVEKTEDDERSRTSVNGRTESQVVAETYRQSVLWVEPEATLTFKDKMKVLWSNPSYLYLVGAGTTRFFASYSLGFFSGEFFEKRYPDYQHQFAYMNAVVVIGSAFPASMLGGYLGDRLESRYGSIKGQIAGIGSIVASPFMFITYAVQAGFWWSIWSYYFGYFFAEMWYGPSHSLINNLFPSEYQGFAVAAFNLSGALSGTVATLCLSALRSKYNVDGEDERNAEINGYILTAFVLFGYLTCAPLFIMSGVKYSEQLEAKKKKLLVDSAQAVPEQTPDMATDCPKST